MPAKKTAKKAAKKTAKKTAKKAVKETARKTAKSAAKKVAKKTVKKVIPKPAKKAGDIKNVPVKKMMETKKEAAKPANMVECSHCKGVGKCTYGELYDKDRHQAVFSDSRLTSCRMCLEAAGKPANSKKLVRCSVCGGSGEVEAQ